jgi:hypothetical protein
MLEIAFNTDSKVCGTLFMDKHRVRKLTRLMPWALPLPNGFRQSVIASYAS